MNRCREKPATPPQVRQFIEGNFECQHKMCFYFRATATYPCERNSSPSLPNSGFSVSHYSDVLKIEGLDHNIGHPIGHPGVGSGLRY